jgi:hypothetical protein
LVLVQFDPGVHKPQVDDHCPGDKTVSLLHPVQTAVTVVAPMNWCYYYCCSSCFIIIIIIIVVVVVVVVFDRLCGLIVGVSGC